MTCNIFVYGTLLKNEKNHTIIREAKCLSQQAWTYGLLYDTKKGYPAMTIHNNNRVYGEVYEISKQQLKEIDELEGFKGEGKKNHYERIIQTVMTDFGLVEAYVYVYPINQVIDLKEIDFGDWRCHQYLSESELLYFAYGSCMDNERFISAGVSKQFSNIIGCGILNNYSMVYTLKSHDGGRADMIESKEWVEGKVYKINRRTLTYLFEREGVNSEIYRPAFIDVKVKGKLYSNVLTFFVIEKDYLEVAPPNHYAKEILRGAKDCVSESYYQKLKQDLEEKFYINTNALMSIES